MVEIKDSGIHGKGLFATAAIARGTIIGTVVGRSTRRDGPYVIWIDERSGIDVQNELRYINHSADPNAAYYDDCTVVALRDIAPGEEITHDYDGLGEDWTEH